jgi:DNA helicase II / ATP-dependent DNA helicase PcrA
MAIDSVIDARIKDERAAPLRTVGSMLVSACPGSGKTTLIATKIVAELDALEGTAGRILCLTYTRAAVASLREKLRAALGDADLPGCFVSTIHGFALRQILRPYSDHVGFPTAPRLVTTQSVEYIELLRETLDDPVADPDALRNVRRARDGEPIGDDQPMCEAARRLWAVLEARSLVDLTSLLYYAYRLLSEQAWISRALSARYEWIIIDEFQDTGDLAIALLECLRESASSKFMLVADGRQTIYGFAGVDLDQLSTFLDATVKERFTLTGSFRCGEAVCRDASSLFPSKTFTSNRMKSVDSSLTEYCDVSASVEAITDVFIPRLAVLGIDISEAAILCAWRKPLLPIAGVLRGLGVPVRGAVTKLYEETFLSAFVEAFSAYSRRSNARNARRLYDSLVQVLADTEEAVDIWEYAERIESLYTDLVSAAIKSQSVTFKDLLLEVVRTVIYATDSLNLKLASSIATQWTALVLGIEKMDNVLQTFSEEVDPLSSITISTIHGSKGLEYRAVAIVRLNDGVLPSFRVADAKGYGEEKRKLFVAITRAMDYVLYITDLEGFSPRPSRYLQIIKPAAIA